MTSPALIVAAILAGAICAAPLAGALESYTVEEGLRPWPSCRACPSGVNTLLFLPLLGPLLGWRQMAACRHHAPWRLPLLQLLQGALWGGLAARYGATPLLPVAIAQATLLLAVVFVDARHRLIPYGLVVPGAVLALASSPLWPGLGPASSLLGGVGAFAAFTLLVRVAGRVFGEGAFGQGDANLAGWIGLLSGYPLVIVPLSVGVFLGGLGAVAVLILRRGARRATMPYGPYLVAGALYVLLVGNNLYAMYSYL